MEKYNYMAVIIRILLEHKFDVTKVSVVSESAKTDIKDDIKKLLDDDSFSLNQLKRLNDFQLVFLLQLLDVAAEKEREKKLWEKFDNIRSIESLLHSERIRIIAV